MVAALIEREGQVLLDRRKKGTHLADTWEFPGGKRDAGETDEAALRRELREELGVDGEIGARVAEVVHAYEDFDVRLVLYEARLGGEPRAIDVAEIRWFPREALEGLPMPPADRPLVEAVLRR